jgi:UDP-3-O-[3-hydroxymyristoyl] N-acetylglucosamine deacetylase
MQHTLQKEASAFGVGLFTGEKVAVRILPAKENTGIVFCRTDLPGNPKIPARLDAVRQTPRCTRLAAGDASIFMVEHLLSALYAYGIDNAIIEVNGPEIPILDGSAYPFVEQIEKSGRSQQKATRRVIEVTEPLYWSEGNVHLVALPAPEFRVSYTMHYPHSALLKSQYYSFSMQPEKYREEIAASRTFSLYEEIIPLIEKGVIKGGGLENGLVIQGDKILNPEGARFQDEMVRHKLLDLLGDLSLTESSLLCHVIAICSGHASNVAFAKILMKRMQGNGVV